MQTSRTPVPGAPRQISSTVNQSPLRSFSDVLRTTVPPSEGIRPPSALPKPPAPSPVMSPIASVLSKTPAPSIAALSGLAKAAGSKIPVPRLGPPGSLVSAIPQSVYSDHIAPAARKVGLQNVLNIPDTQGPKSVPGEKQSPEMELLQARRSRQDPPINVIKTKPVQLPLDNKSVDTQKDSFIGNRIKSQKPADSPTVQDAIEGGSKGSTESPPAIPPVDYSKAPRPPAPSAPIPDRTGSTPAPASTAPTPPAVTPAAPAPAAQQQKPVERPAPGPQRTPAAEVNTPPQKTFKDIRKPAEKPAEDKASGPSWVNDLPGRGGALQNRSRVFGADAGA